MRNTEAWRKLKYTKLKKELLGRPSHKTKNEEQQHSVNRSFIDRSIK